METVVLHAERRELIGKKVKALRRQGRVPAIIYGHAIDPIPISMETRDANRVVPMLTSSQLITVKVGEKEEYAALVRERQRDVILGDLIHIDFLAVSMTETLRASVPVELIGESPAVKNLIGLLVAGVEFIEVEALARDLPDRISVDISGLEDIGDSLTVRDLDFAESVQVLVDLDETIAVITAPAAIEEEEEEEEEELLLEGELEPEVIGREEEGGEGEEEE
jgi:large subunit ribosomal protein L25